MKESRSIPIQMAEGALSQATLEAEPANALASIAPVLVRVGDFDISEAETAREMQHHIDADPHVSCKLAAQALAEIRAESRLLRGFLTQFGLAELAVFSRTIRW